MMTSMTTCAVCGADASSVTGISHNDNGSEYTLYACNACKVQWWSPFENPGANWYEHDGRYADRNLDPIMHPSDKHVGVISRLKGKSGKVLDIGCGIGNFLAHAQEHGWDGWGIDFDTDAISAGKKAFGLENLSADDIYEFASKHPGSRFDLITFFDVIEHLDDHERFMQTVHTLIAKDGMIAFSAPYRHGSRWLMPHDLPPRHLTRWDEESVRRFLERYGYAVTSFVRLPASIYFIALKCKYKYGAWASLGIVRALKEKASATNVGSSVGVSTSRRSMRAVQTLAKAKDLILFGVPATLLWLLSLGSRSRYTDFYVIAKKV